MNHIIQGQREVKLFLLYNVIIFQVITNNAESFQKQRKAENFLKQRDGGTEMFEGQRMASEVCMGFA